MLGLVQGILPPIPQELFHIAASMSCIRNQVVRLWWSAVWLELETWHDYPYAGNMMLMLKSSCSACDWPWRVNIEPSIAVRGPAKMTATLASSRGVGSEIAG